jgi:hypothetical protein
LFPPASALDGSSSWPQGISLPVEQYNALLTLLPQIEGKLSEKGHEVPRPEYGASANDQTAAKNDQDDEDEEEADDPKKSNIEATSDEDED